MTTTVLSALFIAIVGRFMADEIKAWCCWLHKRIRRRAVAKLPAEYKERYDEEWESGLEEIPGELFKLIYSIGLLSASVGICKAVPDTDVKIGTYFDLLKRLFDITFSGIALAIIAPLLILIAMAIKLDSPGPVFYLSERIGKKGRIFPCFKFRTMSLDAEKWNANIVRAKGSDGVVFYAAHDPRITKLGRLLRKYSLDELPQFLNVLRGDMSVVGPRPPIARGEPEYKSCVLKRYNVSPGITGLWQVKGHRDPFAKSDTSLDEIYAKNRSFWLDFKIIARTIKVVLFGTKSGLGKNTHDSTDKDD